MASSPPPTETKRQTCSGRTRDSKRASTPASGARRRFEKASSVANDPFVSDAETSRRPPSFTIDKVKGATKRLLVSSSGSPSAKRRRRNPLEVSVGGDDAFKDFIAAFTAMLRFSTSVRMIEISQVHGLCPEWIQVSRLKDFINLRRLRVEFCAPWDLELFEVNSQYQQSLLDLVTGHDTHFDIDFYAYDSRSSGEWNVVGPCVSRSTFERVYKFVRDRHPQLLLQGSLVNQMLTE
ncbi:uncharacterized protein Aud_001228 [Aspergillus udagawae]|uniref:Uncharacterized protein n=1 Tax=Aspergillus udagawae TaxID=91492 RepID=A0A8E0QHJ7_9EURO|nr:uncharacterized protein Aud_001228 [Aspergillus udagawae]GIC85397.1 hypothetical protein Aud_001228 [Aspergillus udagawae]